MLGTLCPPALIYLIFSTTQIVIDTLKGFYNTVFIKIWVTFAFTILLNFLCKKGLGIVSWIIVFIPFILMTLIISILLIMFGLDPSTGRTKVYKEDKEDKKEKKEKKGGTVPATAMVDPIVIAPDSIQNAYDDDPPGLLGPDGEPRGYESEAEVAMERSKNRRAYEQKGLGGVQPSNRAGDKNTKCQTFCSKTCTVPCERWGCPICREDVPPAPADLIKKCKKPSPACLEACTEKAASVCLINATSVNAHLNPNKKCVGWSPCMILHRNAGGNPAGFSKHGELGKLEGEIGAFERQIAKLGAEFSAAYEEEARRLERRRHQRQHEIHKWRKEKQKFCST